MYTHFIKTIILRHSLLCVFVFGVIQISPLKSQHCGTVPNQEQINYIKSLKPVPTRELKIAKGIVDIPYQIFIVRKDDKTGGIDQNLIKGQIQSVNEIFIKANIRLVPFSDFKYIDNSAFYEFNVRNEDALANKHDIQNVLNIYAFKEIKGGYFGYTYHPEKSRKNRMFIAESGFENNSTLPHELGHFFGLYHTHGKGLPNNDEPISRNADLNNNGILDCYETGDDLCDTPADPNLGLEEYRTFCLDNCEMESKIKSHTGDFYNPHITNLMCYNRHSKCRSEFTDEQLSRIAQTARLERSKLRMKSREIGKKVKGNITFQLKNGDPMPLDLDINLYTFQKAYKSGQFFSFEIDNLSQQRLFISIINMDSHGEVHKVYPYRNDLTFVTPGQRINPMSGHIELDNNVGREYTCILFSNGPIAIDKITEEMKLHRGTFTQRLYNILGDVLLPLDQVKYSYGNAISFEGYIAENEVLPIMIEMQHDN